MRRPFSRLCLAAFLLCLGLAASAQPSNSLTLLANWDNPNLPVNFNLVYNEVFGWHDGNGREYAILGSHQFTYFIEVTNPSAPVVRDSVPGTYGVAIHRDFKTYGHYCYGVADEGNSTLQVIDMSFLPDSVHVVFDSPQFFERAHNLFIDTLSGRAYIAGSNTQPNGVIILDVGTNPALPTLLASHNLGSYTHDLSVRGDTAYMNNGNDGLRILDFRNPTLPVMLASMPSYPQQGYNHSSWLTPDGDYLAMCDETRNKSCKMVDVSNLGNVHVASFFRSALLYPPDSGSIPHNPLVAGQYICVAYYHDGVQLWDISDPLAPQHAAGYDTYPTNTNYNDWYGAWGCYPFLPSGTLLGSDIHNGLFVFRVPFPFPYPLGNAPLVTPATCSNGSNGAITLQPSGGTSPYTYLWASGQTTPVRSGLAPGSYVVTITDRHGYTHVDTIAVPAPAALNPNAQIAAETCPGTGDGEIDLQPTGGTAPYAYAWSTGDQVQDIIGLTSGAYSVTITDSLGCTLVDTFTVSNLLPGPLADAGPDTSLCDDALVVSALPPTQGTGHWQWISGGGAIQNPALPATIVTGLQPGDNALAWVVFDGQCSSADTLHVWVSAAAFVDAGPDTVACTASMPLSGSSPGQGQGTWTAVPPVLAFSNTGDPNATVSGLQPGTYTLYWTVADGNCLGTDSLSVLVSRQPFAAFSYTIVSGTATFNNVSQNATGWFWTFGDGGTSTVQNPVHAYALPGLYNVCLVAIDTCGRDTTCQSLNIVVTGSSPAMEGLSLYPQPFGGTLMLATDLPWREVQLRLYDMQGRLLRDEALPLEGGRAAVAMPGLPPGLYWVEVQAEGRRIVRKVQHQ